MGNGKWDAHDDVADHGPLCRQTDKPIAGLITDLKQRGMLDSTMVVWATEFGRTPYSQNNVGRDHNPHGFTCFLAGAGVKAPFTHGATDAFGYKAVENVATMHDLHATILHLLGLDHERLTFYHNGIERRLTDVHGQVIRAVLTSPFAPRKDV